MTQPEQTTSTYVNEYRQLPATNEQVHPFYRGLTDESSYMGAIVVTALQEMYE